MSMAQSFADTVWQKVGRVSYRKIKLGTGSSATVHRAPYYGDLVTSDYDVSAALLTLWFHYAAEDADVTLRLKQLLTPRIEEAGLHDLYFDIEEPMIEVLADMEMTGVCIDTEALSGRNILCI